MGALLVLPGMLIASKANSCCERAFHSQGTGWQGLAGAARRALISDVARTNVVK